MTPADALMGVFGLRCVPLTGRTAADVGARIRAARGSLGLSAAELGRRVKQHESAVCRWERGEAYPSAPNLVALCDALAVSADWLLGRVP